MKKGILFSIFILTAAISFSELKSNLTSNKMVMVNNQMQMMPADNATPGDTLVYTLALNNENASGITNVNPVIPIPSYTTLVPSMVEPANFMVTTDNQNYVAYPQMGANNQPVSDNMYKSVKWDIGNMNANEAKTMKIGVKINN